MPKNDLKYWTDVVQKSSGKSAFLPEKFHAEAKRVEKLRTDYNAKMAGMAEEEIDMRVATQNLFHSVRKELKDNGFPDAFLKNIGFNDNALNDGYFIVNLTDNLQQ